MNLKKFVPKSFTLQGIRRICASRTITTAGEKLKLIFLSYLKPWNSSLVHQLKCTLEEFCELFLNDLLPIGPAAEHMLEFWNRRNQDNILFLKYEDMKRDLPSVIRKCADFLQIDRITEKDIDKMCDHLKFDKMQKNPAVNLEPILFKDQKTEINETMAAMYEKVKFIRKGQIGDWKNSISEETSRKFDEWAARKFKGSGLEFDYEWFFEISMTFAV